MSEQATGQYVAYTFFKVDPAWRRLPIEERVAAKDAFADVAESWAERLELRAYSTAGVRPDCDFFLWKITERYEDLGELGAALNGTPLAGWLETPYSYLATTKASQYTSARRPRKIVPRGHPYLVVYPFVKVRPWYALSAEERQRAMDEHIQIGARFASIQNHTTYSFGIDDQEFMTAFECEEPSDFMHLMLTLRDSEASRYTERDTPIFVGQAMELRAALDALDGAASRVGAQQQAWSNSLLLGVLVLVAPDSYGGIRAGAEDEEERERVRAARTEADEGADVDDSKHDRGVEDPLTPVRPGLDVGAPLAPEQEEEERDREEERDPQQSTDRREHFVEREHDDDRGNQRDDQKAAQGRVHVGEETLHDPPVMNARTASAAASAEVPANHASRFGPSAGA